MTLDEELGAGYLPAIKEARSSGSQNNNVSALNSGARSPPGSNNISSMGIYTSVIPRAKQAQTVRKPTFYESLKPRSLSKNKVISKLKLNYVYPSLG